jgi:branched-subunit amino acid ABC-type transport system permease component
MKAPSFVVGEHRMKKAVLVLAAGLALAGCGTQMGDRMASGAAIGGSAGLVAGGVGVIPGALVGAAVGGLTSPEQVNLGEPVWDKDDDGNDDE